MFTIALFITFLSVVTAQTNYCSISSAHTMCRYRAKACTKGLLASTVSADDIAAILKAHNDLRSKVANGRQNGQPTASNMRELKWDAELATIAQRWADQCNYGHDSNRNTKTFSYVGQNVAMTSSSASSASQAEFPKVIQMWYDEVTNPGFNSRNIQPFVFGSGTGHYTQIVWADTTRIGCGYAYYKEGFWYNKYYVCNYGTGGNIISGTMYKKGQPASACSAGKSNAYPGLCSS